MKKISEDDRETVNKLITICKERDADELRAVFSECKDHPEVYSFLMDTLDYVSRVNAIN